MENKNHSNNNDYNNNYHINTNSRKNSTQKRKYKKKQMKTIRMRIQYYVTPTNPIFIPILFSSSTILNFRCRNYTCTGFPNRTHIKNKHINDTGIPNTSNNWTIVRMKKRKNRLIQMDGKFSFARRNR